MKNKDKMKLWLAVEKTDPKYTKTVNQRGGFTAIDAQWQLMQATQQWGPCGQGWGYDTTHGTERAGDNLLSFCDLRLWWRDDGSEEQHTFGPIRAYAVLYNGSRIDADAGKKCETDALTKALSRCGFSADIFLNEHDSSPWTGNLQADKRTAAAPAPTRTAPAQERANSAPSATIDQSNPPPCPKCKGAGEANPYHEGNPKAPPFRCAVGCREQGSNGRDYPLGYRRATAAQKRRAWAMIKEAARDAVNDGKASTEDAATEQIRGFLTDVIGAPDSSADWTSGRGAGDIDRIFKALEDRQAIGDYLAGEQSSAAKAAEEAVPAVEKATQPGMWDDVPF